MKDTPITNIQQFRGTGVALVTPFRADGAIDWEALERVINHVIEGGVNYLVSLGTTGEAITLSNQECQDVLAFTVKTAAERVPVVAGFFGHNSTAHLVEKFKETDFTGVAAILSSSPSYNKPTQEGIYQHYMAVADAAPRPIILYNVPSRTSSNVAPETVVRLAHDHKNIIAVKEASGVLGQAMSIIKHKPEHFLVLSGDDPITLGMIGCGGDGVISVIANSFPNEFAGMVTAALNGDYATAQSLNTQLLDVHPNLYVEGNPVGVKSALQMLGICENYVRLPLVRSSEKYYNALKIEVEKAGLLATV